MELKTCLVIFGLSCLLGCSREAPPATPTLSRPLGNLEGRRTWRANAVKIWLKNPDVVVPPGHPKGNPDLLHAWPGHQNDYSVPMARINEGAFLYEISPAEYSKLQELNTRHPAK